MERPMGSLRRDDPPIVLENKSFRVLLMALIDDPKGLFLRVLGKVEGCNSLFGGDSGTPRDPLLVGDVAL